LSVFRGFLGVCSPLLTIVFLITILRLRNLGL